MQWTKVFVDRYHSISVDRVVSYGFHVKVQNLDDTVTINKEEGFEKADKKQAFIENVE